MKTFKFKKEDRIVCTMTTLYEVKAQSLAQAKKVSNTGEQVGLMFTESDILEEGGIKYVKDK